MMDAHETRWRCRRILWGLVFSLMTSVESPVSPARAGDPEPKRGRVEKIDPAVVEFFEKNVRPILATRCQGCHGPGKQKGGLRLDARAAILAGGATGPAVVPGNAKESLLVDAINYGETYQMPPKSKLPDEEVATLTRWVEMGAPWGFDAKASPTGTEGSRTPDSKEDDWRAVFQARARHWCFQPIRRVTPPVAVGPHAWARNPIDQFILAGLAEHQLSPAPEAARRTLIRRLSYDLTGLPPSPAEVAAFQTDASPDAYERLVDRLLASPHYGERWARHWLDLVRYAETAGHEFDYDILNAFRYRDYVIRAFNRRPALRSIRRRAPGRRPAREPAPASGRWIQRVGHRHRFLLPRRGHAFAGRRPRGRNATDRQPDRRDLEDIPGPDGRLRPMPRSQVRPDRQQRLLRPGRIPPQFPASAGVHRPARTYRRPAATSGGFPEGDRGPPHPGQAIALRTAPRRGRSRSLRRTGRGPTEAGRRLPSPEGANRGIRSSKTSTGTVSMAGR